MGNEYEDDFGEYLMDILKEKYPELVKKIEEDEYYLDWSGAVNISSRNGSVFVLRYSDDDGNNIDSKNEPDNKKWEESFVGTITFKVKLDFDEYNQWIPAGIIKSSVKFIEKKKNSD